MKILLGKQLESLFNQFLVIFLSPSCYFHVNCHLLLLLSCYLLLFFLSLSFTFLMGIPLSSHLCPLSRHLLKTREQDMDQDVLQKVPMKEQTFAAYKAHRNSLIEIQATN